MTVGSLRVVADETGNAVKEVVYDSFGNVSEDTNPAFRMPIGFAGGPYDPDTGLVRVGRRDSTPTPAASPLARALFIRPEEG